MYEQVFNLTSRPFTSIHYVKHYFPATEIDQSLQQTKMLVERGSGPVVVVGDHGMGKTLFLAILEERFKSQFRIVNISASLLRSREDLLQNILFQLQMNCRGLGENEMRLDLVEKLKDDQSGGILLMIDDAQKLTVESVEEMQLLTDFILDGQPRVRLVLAGSQGIEERLADTRLISFNQRIAGRFFLSSLNSGEVEQYVRAHLERAGGQPEKLFAPDSFKAIYEVSEGCPRYINQVCDHAMIFAATRGIVPVTDSLVREAWYDIQKLPGCVAPSGSGAAMSASPISVQSVETDSEGWTVLEFGELSDADAESIQSVSESVSPPAAEVDATIDEVFVDASPDDAELDQSTGGDAVENNAAEQQPQPQPIPGPSFSVAPSGEVKTTQVISSEQAEDQPAGLNVPSVTGGAAILASAMAGFGVASNDPTSVPEVEAFEESEPETVSPSVEVLTEAGISPAVDSVETVAEEIVKPADVPASVLGQTLDDAKNNTQDDPSPTSPVFEDPFAADEYENEEVLVNTYSPFVAQQNQRSLDVTSEQLQNLTPGETVNESTEQQPDSDPVKEETFPTFETAMAPQEPAREAQKPAIDPREAEITRMESGLPGPNSLSDEFVVSPDAALFSGGQPAEEIVSSINLEPVEATPGSMYVPLDPDASPIMDTPDVPHLVDSTPLESPNFVQPEPIATAESHVQEPPKAQQPIEQPVQVATASVSVPEVPAVEPAPVPVSAIEPVAVVDPVPSAEPTPTTQTVPTQTALTPTPQFHEQAASPDDPEIRRQAEEIIRSLGTNVGAPEIQVSHETPSAPISIQQETNAIEATIQRSIPTQPVSQDAVAAPTSPVVMPNLDDIKNALRQAQDVTASPNVVANTQQPPPVSGQIPVQMAGVDPVEAEQKILSEVREQVSFVSDTVAAQQTSHPNASQPVAGQDDRAILEVSQNQPADEEFATAESQEAPMPSWSQQEPSQGEAARVDYQRLFDQLRNVQGNQE